MINNRKGDAIAFDKFFWASFISTTLTSAFGLTKLLKVGPCQLMPRDKFGVIFMLTFFCNIFGLLGKGCLLHVLSYCMAILGFTSFYAPMICIITSILPPMTFVSKLVIHYFLSLYFLKKTSKTCLHSNFSNSLTL